MTAASNSDARKRQQERRADTEPMERLREAARWLRGEGGYMYMKRGVGAALADWMDLFADYSETGENAADETVVAHAVADQILGGER